MNDNNDRKRQSPDSSTNSAKRTPRRAKTALGPDIQNKIGNQLRAMYTDVVSEGVPDRFAELINKLEQQSRNKESE